MGGFLFLFIFIMYMNNNLLNETFNKHLNLLRSRLKLDEGEMESSPSTVSKNQYSEKYTKIREYAMKLLADKSFYYERPEGRLQLIHKIKSHFRSFYHSSGVQDLKDKELLDILDYVLSDDEEWVTAKDTRLGSDYANDKRMRDYVRNYSSRTRAMPPNPEKFSEFPGSGRQNLEPQSMWDRE